MLLEIKNLQVHYDMAEALKGISLNIDEGEIIALVGANGAGKTTTLRAISKLISPSSGEIWFNGERIDKLPSHKIVQKGIAHVPEGREVFAPMTVLDNLKMGAYLRKDRHQITTDLDTICEHFPVLKARRGQKAGSLSGGEQQMLAVGRALMASPKLILMDEPSMGLSPIMVQEVATIIKDINRRGISILLVEQNARMALKLARKAYILEVGSIVLEGECEKLFHDARVIRSYLGG